MTSAAAVLPVPPHHHTARSPSSATPSTKCTSAAPHHRLPFPHLGFQLSRVESPSPHGPTSPPPAMPDAAAAAAAAQDADAVMRDAPADAAAGGGDNDDDDGDDGTEEDEEEDDDEEGDEEELPPADDPAAPEPVSALLPGSPNQLTLLFQGEVYVFESVTPEKVGLFTPLITSCRFPSAIVLEMFSSKKFRGIR